MRARGHLLVPPPLRLITEPTVCVDYNDEYVRLGPEWRFAVRNVELVRRHRDPGNPSMSGDRCQEIMREACID